MKNTAGFTLVELLIVMAIAAILAVVGVPSLWNFIQNARTTAQANELVTAINLARSEAVKRGEDVEVCSSTDGATCGGGWSDGWIVREATGANEVIRVWDGLPPSATINDNGTSITFSARGGVDSSLDLTLQFDGCTGNEERRIRVNAAGRPSVVRQDC